MQKEKKNHKYELYILIPHSPNVHGLKGLVGQIWLDLWLFFFFKSKSLIYWP